MKIQTILKSLLLNSLMVSSSFATFSFTDDLGGYTAGGAALAGQGGWETTGTSHSQTSTGPNLTFFASVQKNIATGVAGGTYLKRTVDMPFQLNETHQVTLSFTGWIDPGAAGANNISLGFGRDPDLPGSNVPNHLGLFAGYSVRTFGYGSQHFGKDEANVNLDFRGTWVEFQAVYDLGSGTASLAYRGLNQSTLEPLVTSFTPVFFDQAQVQQTVSLGDLANISEWDTLWIRMGTGGSSRLSSVSMEVIPEPSNVVLVLGAIAMSGVVLLRRIRSAR